MCLKNVRKRYVISVPKERPETGTLTTLEPTPKSTNVHTLDAFKFSFTNPNFGGDGRTKSDAN